MLTLIARECADPWPRIRPTPRRTVSNSITHRVLEGGSQQKRQVKGSRVPETHIIEIIRSEHTTIADMGRSGAPECLRQVAEEDGSHPI